MILKSISEWLNKFFSQPPVFVAEETVIKKPARKKPAKKMTVVKKPAVKKPVGRPRKTKAK